MALHVRVDADSCSRALVCNRMQWSRPFSSEQTQ
eukprot:COSAG02_NODE_48282_length_335_cov_0.461864_1_plen_33_part_10